jgi:hypothetical protein
MSAEKHSVDIKNETTRVRREWIDRAVESARNRGHAGVEVDIEPLPELPERPSLYVIDGSRET